MTPDEQNEIDTLKQELRTTQKLLEDAKGRIKAVELDSYEIKRNAKLATEQAEALKSETDQALATAAEHMKAYHSVALCIYGMAELGRAFMARKVTAARVTHRQAQDMAATQALIDAVERKDDNQIKTAVDNAKRRIATVKADGEQARNKLHEYSLAYGFKNYEQVFDKLIREGE